MMKIPSRERIENLRKMYPEGCRVELVQMSDPYTKLRPGDKGSVIYVDDMGTVHINWDSGSTLGAVIGEDVLRKL